MVGAWSAVVGGTGRPALYLKVGPPGLGLRPYHGPRGQGPPVAGFKGCRPVRPQTSLGMAEVNGAASKLTILQNLGTKHEKTLRDVLLSDTPKKYF